ncbi:MAG: tRNA (N(6)-L-threonylcarbamoyladenosine(37)-C(2))-methylthiotransferase MtaB, partial [Clostridia bacterium]|nr:tRNA (N(6)-L-threonylcarbamoyladenosine(37)-C(2))-methylthiotransferase MtaB [Clostridia bacterium]
MSKEEIKKVAIITLGCKVNQYESESMADKLKNAGIDVSHELCDADAYIINTCAVTNEAERKSRGIIAKVKKINQNAPIYICGCSSQHNADRFKSFDKVKAIFGTSSKDELVDLVIDKNFNKTNGAENVCTNGAEKVSNEKKYSDDQVMSNDISDIYQDNYNAKSARTRTVIKIQDGCNNFCTYCLIPYVRGRERSRSLDSVENEVKNQAKTSKEIVFTGINLSAYGKDFNNGTDLGKIAILMQKYPNTRFKFSSLEQNIINQEFLTVLKNTPNFAPHFHLSLQSGCDKTLKNMNRKYTANEFYSKVELIRKFFPHASITTDIIVGFPTETEDDFDKCFQFAKKCKFAKMHIFPYSSRSGTVASKMKNIATNVKERVQKLSALDKQMQQEYFKLCKDKNFDLIVERKDEESGLFEGHTENYIKCYVKSEKDIKSNTLLKVKIKE